MDATAQARFAAALRNPALPAPPGLRSWNGSDPARRLAVYRNNVTVSLLDALAARFPVTQALVGAEFFRAMARRYLAEEPPRSRLLHEYGDMLPSFVARFAPAREVPYLADVARLEAARTQAYHAADVPPVPRDAFAAIAPEAAPGLTVRLHPSVRVIASAWPVLAIWLAHRQGEATAACLAGIDLATAERVLVARPRLEVRLWLLPPAGEVFLAALGDGATLAQAAARAVAGDPEFDLTAGLTTLIEAEIAIGLSLHGALHHD
jgi:hypothetical protein